ncbi:hypothetical protein [Yoonia sp.]|uniref:hypothetical protein n=1 Tax=Yoonia sp. TaxID=2212373 RepID=UPI002FDB90B1
MPETRPKLIVHIGQSKTGSTSLQNMLGQSRDSLMREGIFYPQVGFYDHHSRLLAYLSGGEYVPRFHLRAFDGDFNRTMEDSAMLWRRIKDDIGRHHPDTIILSAEQLFEFGSIGDGLVNGLVGHLRSLSDDITIVAYLRAPADRFLSLKQEGLKHGDPPIHLAPKRDFETGLDPYAAYPDIRLEVHHFARETLVDGDIAADFARKYIPASARAQLVWPARDLNTTLSAEMMAICEEISTGTGPDSLNRKTPLPGPFSRYLAKIDDALPGKTRPTYKPGVARAVHDTFMDLDWLEARFGIRFRLPDATPLQIEHRSLTTVRSLCVVDEERYARLVARIPGPVQFELIQRSQPVAHWIKRTPMRFRRNLRRLLGPLSHRCH